MEIKESSERKSLVIKTLAIVILILLALMSSVLYVFLYPKTQVLLYDSDYNLIDTITVRRYSKLKIPEQTKPGYTFTYWSYGDFGGEPLDTEREVEDEVVKLYANYNVNQYKVTYYVRTYDPVNDSYFYNTNVTGCLPMEYDYGTTFNLPTGRIGGNLIPELQSMYGFHFVGWTTIPISEDNVEVDEYLYYAGSECTISTPGDINFYAYWEKNTYDVYLHNGIQYEMELDGITPKKDANGKPIIKNILDDIDNEKNSYVMSSIRYLDYVTDVSENFLNIELDAKNATPTGDGVGYTEYDFGGWYLDPEYNIGATDYIAEVRLDGEQPYILYYVDGNSQRINAELTGLSKEGEKQYAFHLYSKWVRRAYNITFNKNANGSSGRLDKIELYKYDEEYGKYYDNGNFSREGYAQGTTYTTIDFLSMFETSEFANFGNSYKNYRLLGFTTTKSSKTEGCQWYYQWKQDPWNSGLLSADGTKIFNPAVRDNYTYKHESSENITLYAQWSREYTITFAYASGQNQKSFSIKGIESEWFWLPDEGYITEQSGSMWTKEHSDFAGWRSAINSLDIKKLYNEDKTLNAGFYYNIGKANETFYVYWAKTPYTITFLKNDGTDGKVDYPICYGNDTKYFPQIDPRPGYIFNGWSKTKYSDNEYASLYRQKGSALTSSADEKTYSVSSTFTVKGHTTYYATWTIDYTIEYDSNLGVFNGTPKTSYNYSELIANKTNPDLRASLYVGKGIDPTRENYTFGGWLLRKADGTLDNIVIYKSSTKSTTFDFLDGVYYPKPATAGSVVPETSKKTLHIVDGNKIVLVAKWDPVKFNVKIVDTKATSEAVRAQTIGVAYNEEFVFPIGYRVDDDTVIPYDNKLGYKLEGFSSTQAGSVEYVFDPANMPTIPANTITSGVTFYTVYTEMNITLSYWISNPADPADVTKYTPTGSQYVSGEVKYGTVVASLPTPSSTWYPTNRYTFKYWYYTDGNGEEVIFNVGDAIKYHDADRNLKLFAKFELEEYTINLVITDPYDNNKTVKTISSAKVVEKGTRIEADFLKELTDMIYAELPALFEGKYTANGILNGTLNGYQYLNLSEINYKNNILDAGDFLNSSFFEILNKNPSSITFSTNWLAKEIAVTYSHSENIPGVPKEVVDTITFGNLSEKTAGEKTFDLSSLEKYIGSWIIKNESNEDVIKYLACNALFVDGSLFKSYTELIPFVSWNDDGTGAISLVANTEQVCYVYYHTAGETITQTQTFTLGEDVNLIDGSTLMTGDFKFAGWYYNGELITEIPELNEANGYKVHVYADKTLDITYRNITFVGMGISYNVDKVETINVLKYISNEYIYISSYVLTYYPEQSELNGYIYYGLIDGNNNIYTLVDIINENAPITIGSENIVLDVCLAKEYTVTYSLNPSQLALGATFEDGSIDAKVHKYLVTFGGVALQKITIDYNAKLDLYTFAGWKIVGDPSNTIYYFGNEFVPSRDIEFQPHFIAPDSGTIDAKIILLSGDGSDRREEINVKNTENYTFSDTTWTSGSKIIYAWQSEDGTFYYVGDTFTVPLAIEAGSTYTFTAQWIDKYTANFTLDSNHQNASLAIRNMTVTKGSEYVLTEENNPKVTDDSVTFLGWLYVDKYNNPIRPNGENVYLKIGDKVIFGTSEFSYLHYADGTTDYALPAPSDGSYGYYFLSVWDSKAIDVTFNIVDESGNILTEYTFVKTVEYGTTLDSREVLPDSVLALETEGRGIIGWTTSSTNFETPMPNVLQGITIPLTVYSVWKSKLTLSFATGENFGYTETMADRYLLSEELIDLNDIINKIYYIDSTTTGEDNTVYYNNGKFLFVKQNANLVSYYMLTGFEKSTGGSIDLTDKYLLPTFKISENTVLTPVFTRVYEISFYDNSNSTGGQKIDSIDNIYLKSGSEFNIITSGISYNRVGFDFGGWNTESNGVDGMSSITIAEENIKLYAIWNSTRIAIFRFKTGTNSYNQLFSISFNKDNKISSTILDGYLKGEAPNGNLIPIVSLHALGHRAYVYNFNNWYLTSFASGVNTYTYAELINTEFTDSGNVYITLNVEKIYTIEFNKGASTGVVGTMPASMYFVNLSNGNIGQMIAGGEFEETLVLPTALDVVRENYVPVAWATGTNTSATKYLLSTSAVELDKNELADIALSLDMNNTFIYNLYLIWEYKKVSIAVYNLVDDEYDGLTNPYDVYSMSTESHGEDIVFDRTPSWVVANNSALLVSGGDGDWQTEYPQVSFNSRIYFNIPVGMSNEVGGYRLLGFSRTLAKLGEVPDVYYRLNDTTSALIIESSVILEGDIVKFYPVYELITESVHITSYNGYFSYTLTSGITEDGYVAPIDTYESSYYTYQNVTINAYHILTITTNRPVNGEYSINSINGVKVTGTTHLFGYGQGGNEIFDNCGEENSHAIEILYTTKLLNVNFVLEYEVPLKSSYEDTTNISFEGTLSDNTQLVMQLTENNPTYANAKIYANEKVFYSIDVASDYFTYEIENDGKTEIMSSTGIISLDELVIDETQNPDDSYNATIKVIAKPIAYKVTFSMQLGTLLATELSASSDVYEGVTNFAISKNIANVYAGSTITLPTAEDIKYITGKFEGFSVNGDPERKFVTSYPITDNIIFVENYVRNFFTIQYEYNGIIEQVTSIPAGDTILVNCENALNQDGYTFLYWGDGEGNKLFDNGDELEVNQNYYLYAYYEGKAYTITYVYDGNEGRESSAIYGNSVTMLDGKSLNDATKYEDKYIYGWKLSTSEDIFVGGMTYTNSQLNSSFQENVILNAVYMPKIKYTIEYDNSNISNGSSLPKQYLYLHTSSNDGGAYMVEDLNIRLHSLTPVSNSAEFEMEEFTHYSLFASENGSSYEEIANVKYSAGEMFTVDKPIADDSDDKVYLYYRLRANFAYSNETISVEYVITNPTSLDRDSVSATNTLATQTIQIFSSTKLTDVYLPNNMTDEENSQTNFGTHTNKFVIGAKGITLEISEDIDWNKYTLVGYKVEILGTDTVKEFVFGSEANRGVSGGTGVKLYPIWEDNYIVNYHNYGGAILSTLYYKYDMTEEIRLLADPVVLTVREGYRLLGWTENENLTKPTHDDYYGFGTRIAINNYDFYPAYSQEYKLNIISSGIHSGDEDKFELSASADSYTVAFGYVFTFENKVVYTKSDLENYSFIGYSLSEYEEDLLYSNGYLYIFDYNDINDDGEIDIYAIWDKNSYKVTINFEALANTNAKTNLAQGYSVVKSINSGDAIEFSYNNDFDVFTDPEINKVYKNFVNLYNYFEFGSVNVSLTFGLYIPNGDEVLTINLRPIVRLRYEIDMDANCPQFTSDGGRLDVGEEITNLNPLNTITHASKLVKYWTMDGENNFFDGDDKRVITSSDIALDKLSEDYVLTLSLAWETAYKFNLYYFANETDLLNNEYTALFVEPINLKYGDALAQIVNGRDYTSIIDEYIEELNLSGINNLYDITIRLPHYTCSQLIVNNNNTRKFDIWDGANKYIIKSYEEGSLLNNVYLQYVAITYNVSFASVVVENVNGELIQKSSRGNVKAEIALTNNQLNDDGSSSIAINNQRHLVSVSGVTYSLRYTNNVYFFDDENWVRANNAYNTSLYRFIGWRFRVADGVDAKGNPVYKFVDYSGINVQDLDTYYRLYNIEKDIALYAVFTEKDVDIEISLVTSRDVPLDIKVSISKDNSDYEMVSTVVNNNTIALTSQFNKYLKLEDLNVNDIYDIKSIEVKDLQTSIIAGDGVLLTPNLVGANDKLYIIVEFEISTINIYFSTFVEDSAKNRFKGNVNNLSYTFKDIDLSTTKITNISTPIVKEKFEFGYWVTIEKESVIDTIGVVLNNYTLSGWKYITADGSIANVASFENIGEISENLYLIAILTPKTINVKFVANDGENGEVELRSFNVPYGTYITLPYIIYESNYVVTNGWTNGEFGVQILISDKFNLEYKDQVFVATFVNNYKLQFTNSYNTSQTFATYYISSQEVVVESGVSYTHITNYNNTWNELEKGPEVLDVVISKTNAPLPSTTLVGSAIDVGKYNFGGWRATSGVYAGGDNYEFNGVDANNHVIEFMATTDTSKVINFVVTDPVDNTSLEVYTKADYSDTPKDSISLQIDMDNPSSLDKFIHLTNTKNPNQWTVKNKDKKDIINYFTNSSYIGSRYKFHGWAITQNMNAESAYSSNKAVVVYSTFGSNVVINGSTIISKLWTLIDGGNYQFYPIWEEKALITFSYKDVDKDDAYLSRYYAKGEAINVPNPNNFDIYVEEYYKWIGWTDGFKDYHFDESGKIEIVCDGSGMEFIPLFSDAYSITIDLNFDGWREHFGETMQPYAGRPSSQIKANTGYPQLMSLNGFVGTNLTTINSNSFFTGYKYNELLVAGSELDLSFLQDKHFSQAGVYIDGELGDYAGNIQDKYYNLVGWKINGSNVLVSHSDLENLVVNENIVLTAEWAPINLSIHFYNMNEIYITSCGVPFGSLIRDIKIDGVNVLEYYRALSTFKESGYRFTNWSAYNEEEGYAYGNNSVLSGSNLPIVANMGLIAQYIKSFQISYYNSNDDWQGTSEEDYIAGEKIDVKNHLEEFTNTDLITEVYYYDDFMNIVDITSYKDSGLLTFNPDEWFQEEDSCVYIYFGCSLTINLYVPDPVNPKGAAKLLHSDALELGSTYNYMTSNALLNKIDRSAYGLGYIDGFYFSKLSPGIYYSTDEAYRIGGSMEISNYFSVSRLYVDYDGSGDYIVVLNDSAEFGERNIGQNLTINLYCKILLETVVKLDDNAEITGAEIVHNSNGYEGKYYDILSSVKTNNRIISLRYKAVYASENTPNISIKTYTGYTVSQLSIISLYTAKIDFVDIEYTDEDGLIANTGKVEFNCNYTEGDFSRELVDVATMDFTHELQIFNNTKNEIYYRIKLSLLTYDVNYNFNNNVAYIRYKEGTNISDQYSDYLDEGTHNLRLESPIYVDGDMVSDINVRYTYEYNYTDDESMLVYYDIPYGVKLFVNVYAIDNMHYHFGYWNEYNNGLGSAGEYMQLIKPNGVKSTKYLNKEVSFNAVFAENEIEAINMYLVYEPDSGSDMWANILTEASNDLNTASSIIISQKDGKYYILIDTITSLSNTYSLRAKNVCTTAGTNIRPTITNVNENYHNKYNNQKGILSNGKWTLEALLNYFIGEDTNVNEGWFSYSGSTNERLTSYGVIFAKNGATVSLYKSIDKALLIELSSQTIDLDNGEALGIDRANIQLIEYANYYIFADGSNGNNYNGEECNRIVIKMPYKETVKFKVLPDGATNTHVPYELKEFVFLSRYSTSGTNDGTGAVSTKDGITTIYTGNSNISSAWSYYQKGNGAKVKIPDLKLNARVQATTYDVTFDYNYNEGTGSKTITATYDEDLFDKDNEKYAKYNPTLQWLYDTGYAPRFGLQPKNISLDITYFKRSSADQNASLYGEYCYLFKYWSQDGTNARDLNTAIANGDYSDVNLTAIYNSNVYTDIIVYNTDGSTKTYKIWLPRYTFTDQFGTDYSNKISAVNTYLLPKDGNGNAFTDYYVKGSANNKHTKVTNIDQILSLGTNICYPSIGRILTEYYHNLSAEYTEHTLTTLGGKFDVVVNNSGKLEVSNIVYSAGTYIITAYNYDNYKFAYWGCTDSVTNYLTAKDSFSFYTSSGSVTAYYNAKIQFYVDDGSLSIKNASGNTLIIGDTSVDLIAGNSPTGKEISSGMGSMSAGNITKVKASIKYTKFDAGSASTKASATAEVWVDDKLLYTISYTAADEMVAKIAFEIHLGGDVYDTLDWGDSECVIQDKYGNVEVYAIGYPNSVKIEFEDLEITNRTYSTTNFVIYNPTRLSVEGAATITVSDLSSYSYIDGVVTNITFGSKSAKATGTTTATDLRYNIQNLRWQYLSSSNKWTDLTSGLKTSYSYGSTKAEPIMKFRLACEWIATTVTFNKLSSTNTTALGTTSVDSYLLNTNYNSYTLNNATTYTLYKGNSFSYDFANMSFTINGKTISVTNNSGFMHGWILKRGASVTGLTSDSDFSDCATAYNFYSWVEPKKEFKVDVDTNGGLGKVAYSIGYPLISDVPKTYMTLNIDDKTYGNLPVIGESCKLTLFAEQDKDINYGHTTNGNFKNNNTEYSVNNITASRFMSDTFYPIFDYTSSKASFKIDGTHKCNIYGGYTIEVTKSTSATFSIKDYFGEEKGSFVVSFDTSGGAATVLSGYKITGVKLDGSDVSENISKNVSPKTDVCVETIQVVNEITVNFVVRKGTTSSDILTYGNEAIAEGFANGGSVPASAMSATLNKAGMSNKSMGLTIASKTGTIKGLGDFELKSVELKDDNSGSVVSLADSDTTSKNLNITGPSVTVTIYVQENMNRNVYIYSTLPYVGDMERLNVNISKNETNTNITYQKLVDGCEFKVPKTAEVMVDYPSTYVGRLTIKNGSANLLVMTYNIENTYACDGGFVWAKTKHTPDDEYKVIGGYTYHLKNKPAGAVLANGDFTASCDYTICLALKRATVEIYHDSTYWNAITSSQAGKEDAYLDAYNNYSNANLVGTFPGGLVQMVPSTGSVSSSGKITYANRKAESYVSIYCADAEFKKGSTPTGTPIEKISSSAQRPEHLDKGIFVINDNKDYRTDDTYYVDLQLSNKWVVCDIPMRDNITQVTFANKDSSGKDQDKTTFNYYEDGTIWLTSFIVDNLNLAKAGHTKSIYKRINSGLYDDTSSNYYYSTSYTFKYKGSVSGNNKYAISGYKIEERSSATGAVTKTANIEFDSYGTDKGKTINLKNYSKFITITPVWRVTEVYTITIVDKNNVLTATTYVTSGEQWNYSFKLINPSTGETSYTWLYLYSDHNVNPSHNTMQKMPTRWSGNSILMGLNVSSGFALVDGKTINNKQSPDYLRMIKPINNNSQLSWGNWVSGNEYAFTITPQSNLTLQAIWEWAGYSVTYKNIDKLSETTRIAHNNCVPCLGYLPGDFVEPLCSTCGGDHYDISYYKDSAGKERVYANDVIPYYDDTTVYDTIYYKLTHNANHCWKFGTESSYGGCICASRPYRMCDICKTKSYTGSASVSHIVDYEYTKISDSQHRVSYSCSSGCSCATCSGTKDEEHDFAITVDENKNCIRYVGQKCSKCEAFSGTETKEHLGKIILSYSQEPGNDEKHIVTKRCSACKEVTETLYSVHVWDEDEAESGDPTCTSEGWIWEICQDCKYEYDATIPPLGHAWGAWQAFEGEFCGETGYDWRLCYRCRNSETRFNDLSGPHSWKQGLPWNWDGGDVTYVDIEYFNQTIPYPDGRAMRTPVLMTEIGSGIVKKIKYYCDKPIYRYKYCTYCEEYINQEGGQVAWYQCQLMAEDYGEDCEHMYELMYDDYDTPIGYVCQCTMDKFLEPPYNYSVIYCNKEKSYYQGCSHSSTDEVLIEDAYALTRGSKCRACGYVSRGYSELYHFSSMWDDDTINEIITINCNNPLPSGSYITIDFHYGGDLEGYLTLKYVYKGVAGLITSGNIFGYRPDLLKITNSNGVGPKLAGELSQLLHQYFAIDMDSNYPDLSPGEPVYDYND